MSREILVQQQRRWLSFDNGAIAFSDARPRPQRAAVAIVDFEGAVSNVVSLEGSPAHAVALIEKRLRADGLIDSEAKILIHRTRTVGAGYQTLFTAVPLDVWQQSFSWAQAQQDHCLLFPVITLLLNKLKPGQAVVYQSGRQITTLAVLKHNLICRSSLAYSDDPSDLAMTAGALADQLAGDLAMGEDSLNPVKAFWCAALTPAPQGPDPWQDDALREIFSARSGLAIDPVPVQAVTDADGNHYRSGIAWLAHGAPTMAASNPASSRVAYAAEWLLPLASAASIVFAIVLGSLGARWTLSAAQANDQARQSNADAEQVDAHIQTMQAAQTLPARFHETLEFVDRLVKLQATIDPTAGLASIRDAAGDDVRILRVRLEMPPPPGAAQNLPVGTVMVDAPTLRVDGVVDAWRGTAGMQIPTFVDHLRRAGYDPVAVDPQGSAQGAGNYFSYLLKRPQAATAAAGATGTTP